jgi:hypothetical protein
VGLLVYFKSRYTFLADSSEFVPSFCVCGPRGSIVARAHVLVHLVFDRGAHIHIGAAYDITENRESESLLNRRELAAEKICANQWWSLFKGLGSWPGRGLGLKLLLCV